MPRRRNATRTARFNALCALVLSSLASLVPLATCAGERAMFGRNAPVTYERLPMGRLKSSMARLSPQARLRAMTWLHRFDFPLADAGSALNVDAEGSVLYVDSVPANLPQGAPAASGGAVPTGITNADAFRLHSRPGARNVLFLDFDGHLISGTAWNANFSGNLALDALPYDVDGAPANFSATERDNIIRIWQRVAEDYAPFDVDVTTEQPAVSGPTTGRVVITRDADRAGRPMPAQGAGGVAYVGVFGFAYYGYYSPALVYANRLGNGREDYVAEAVSHELGHNLGLSHDGSVSSTYYAGHGSGSTSWAPIMGVGYGRAVTTWSGADYPGATNPEDDVALVRARLGARVDDHAGSASGATPLIAAGNGTVSATTVMQDPANMRPENKGVIGSRDDVDVFTFVANGGPLNLLLTPTRLPSNTPGGNLDLRAELYSAGGALVAGAAPNGDTGAVLATSLAAGRYFLHVSGVGDPLAAYGDYGSMGQFTITGTIPVAGTDMVPPSPNPMAFDSAPTSQSVGTVTMRAALATDNAGAPVQYRFECVSGGAGCIATDWRTDRTLTLGGLTPGANYGFRVQARDAFGNQTAPSPVTNVTVRRNATPIAANDSAAVKRLRRITLAVLANDRDPDGDALQLAQAGPATMGAIALNAGTIVYTARAATGRDVFTYSVVDGRGGLARGTVTISIVP